MQRARRLGQAFAAITILTYGLIVLGALVRAHGAGLACPDWPLCFGEVIPRFDLRVAFEWGHRVAAGGISLLFVGASALVLRDEALHRALRVPIAVSAVLLALQILLGALTVWQLLASWTVTSHLLAGNAFALGLAFTTRRLFRLSAPPPAREPTTALTRAAVSLAAVLMLLQIVVGGLVSSTYAGLACSEWPACNEGVWFPGFSGAIGTHLLHRLLAYALLAVLISCAWLGRSCDGLRGWLWLACAIGVAQVAAGVANVLLRLPIEVTGLHSALAAALVLSLALAFDEAWRRGRVRQ